jgi:hypothetical protein
MVAVALGVAVGLRAPPKRRARSTEKLNWLSLSVMK